MMAALLAGLLLLLSGDVAAMRDGATWYAAGITTRVSTVETKRPKIKDTANPEKIGSSRMKNAPIMAAIAVGYRAAPGSLPELVAAAERKLALRRPHQETAGTVHVEPLTDREREVLHLLRSDLSLREIAGELYISHNTIKSYTQSIYRKLGVTSRSAAPNLPEP